MNAWFNGRMMPAERVTVPMLCHSLGRGSAIFDVLDIVAGEGGRTLFRLAAHVERFFASAAALNDAYEGRNPRYRRWLTPLSRRGG